MAKDELVDDDTDESLLIFISWSGTLSKEIASAIKHQIYNMFNQVKPWMSDEDIEPGMRGLDEIRQKLNSTVFGLIIVTRENEQTPWINFEAGALSKALKDDDVRVAPLLVGYSSPSEVTSPLKQFQGTLLTKAGFVKVCKLIAKTVGIKWDRVSETFDLLWPSTYEAIEVAISKDVSKVRHPSRAVIQKPDLDAMIPEILETVRQIQRQRTQETLAPSYYPTDETDRLKEDLHHYVSTQGGTPNRIQVGNQRGRSAILIGIEEGEDEAHRLTPIIVQKYERRAGNNIRVYSNPSGMNGGEGYFHDSENELDEHGGAL